MSDEGPQALKDEENWIRGNRLQLGRAIAAADTGNETLWQRLYLGDAAIKLMRGVGTRDEISKVMGTVIAECEQDVQRGARALLEMPDLSTPAAQKLHFETRVSAAIIGRLNQLVSDGVTAAAEIENLNEGE